MATGFWLLDPLGFPVGVDGGTPPVVPVDPDPEEVDPVEAALRRAAEIARVDDRDHLVEYNPRTEDQSVDLLYWQHARVKRIPALVRALARGAQLFEDTAFAVIIGASTFDNAEGKNLDKWGAVVGEARGGLTEDDYRRFIALRIRVNTEAPTTQNMGEVVIEAVNPSTVHSYLIADGIVYVATSDPWLDASTAAHAGALVRDFRPAGIYCAVVEQPALNGLELGSIAQPGFPYGTIADPGDGVYGHLIYRGRGA